MKAGNVYAIFLLTFILSLIVESTTFGSEAETKLSIDGAVSTALEKNLNLQLQQNEVEIGNGVELIENGAFDPQVETHVSNQVQRVTSLLVGGLEKEESTFINAQIKKKMITGTEFAFSWENKRSDTDLVLATPDPSYSSAVGVSISQPLLKGNSTNSQTAGIRVAEKYTQAASFLVENQAANLVAQVKNAYWELVFALQDIEVKELSLELAKNLREDTNSKIESGILAEVEIYQPDSEIARREEHLIAAERNIANSEDELKLLINNQEWQTSILPIDTPELSSQKPNEEEVLEKALSKRSDIRAGDLQVDAAEIMVNKAQDDLNPSLTLGGSAGMQGVDSNYGKTIDDTISNPDFSWQVGLTYQLPLGNSTGRGSLVKAKAQLAKTRLNAKLIRRETVRNAKESVRNVILAIKTIDATRKTSLAAQKLLEVEQSKFEVGMATANDVLESQDSFAQALISEKRAIIDLAKARAELDRVQGIVSFRNQREV